MAAQHAFQSVLSGLGCLNLVPPEPEQFTKRLKVVGTVVHDEHAPRSHGASFLRLGVDGGAERPLTPDGSWEPVRGWPGSASRAYTRDGFRVKSLRDGSVPYDLAPVWSWFGAGRAASVSTSGR